MARVRYVNFMNYHSEFIEESNKLAPPSGSPNSVALPTANSAVDKATESGRSAR